MPPQLCHCYVAKDLQMSVWLAQGRKGPKKEMKAQRAFISKLNARLHCLATRRSRVFLASYCLLSSPIQSITSNKILRVNFLFLPSPSFSSSSFPFFSFLFLSVPFFSFLFLSFPFFSFLFLSFPVFSFLFLSFPSFSFLFLSVPFFSFLFLSFPVFSFLFLSFPSCSFLFLPVPFFSFLFLSFPVFSCLFLPVPFFSFLFLSFPSCSFLFLPVPFFSFLFLSFPSCSFLFLPVPFFSFLFLTTIWDQVSQCKMFLTSCKSTFLWSTWHAKLQNYPWWNVEQLSQLIYRFSVQISFSCLKKLLLALYSLQFFKPAKKQHQSWIDAVFLLVWNLISISPSNLAPHAFPSHFLPKEATFSLIQPPNFQSSKKNSINPGFWPAQETENQSKRKAKKHKKDKARHTARCRARVQLEGVHG